MTKIKAALMTQVGAPLEITTIDIDGPGPGEVLVDVKASGLCHSDLSYIDHDYGFRLPILLGHEVAGVVAEVGEGVSGLAPGDHVLTCLAGHCGFCAECVQGRTWLCTEQHRVLGRKRGMAHRLSQDGQRVTQSAHIGGLAEHVLVSELAVTRIPQELPLDVAAVMGCSVVTGVGAATKVARIQPGESVAVVGCGAVGLNILQGARLAGAGKIMAIDIDASKLDMAREFGANMTCDGCQQDVAALVRDATAGGVAHVFDVVGASQTAAQAVDMAARGGHIYLVGQPKPKTQFAFDGFDLVTTAKTVHGVLMGATQFRIDIPRYAELYLSGRLKLDELIGRRLPIEEVNEGFAAMRDHCATGRTVVVFD